MTRSLQLTAVPLFVIGVLLTGHGLLQPAKAWFGQQLLERSFSTGGMPPWPGADMRPVAKISIERLGVTRIVVDRANGEGMAWGPGVVAGSVMPGQSGLSVIAGHRDSHMAFLADIRDGDLVRVDMPDTKTQLYRVEGAMVVDGARWHPPVEQSSNQKILLLTTCWPLDTDRGTTERLVVVATAT